MVMAIGDRAFGAAMPSDDAAPALTRLDSFLYRHRVHDVMSRPLIAAAADTTLVAAAARMREANVSSLVVLDAHGGPDGILTERDLLKAVAARAAAGLALPIGELMSRPVKTVAADAFAYVALGRMDRLELRHLVVTDGRGRAVGMLTQRALLKLRAGQALMLGDRVAAAARPEELATAKAMLPAVAAHLLAEGVDGIGAAAVIGDVIRDLTARGAEIAERTMLDDGWGAAPAHWCLLVLGSGGRGESLLAADQDNALIHEGHDAEDGWFAEFGRRLADYLDQAGVPFCKGGVMARNAQWRHSLADWQREIDRWIGQKHGAALLSVDIFFDFFAVAGNRELADALRRHAVAAAAAPLFLRLLAAQFEDHYPPLGLFGRLLTKNGRVDVKLGGLFPLVAGARVMALRHKITATATAERLAALARTGALNEDDAAGLAEALEFMLRVQLAQQLTDIAAGIPPGNLVDPRRLTRIEHSQLKAMLRRIGLVPMAVHGALGAD